MSGTLYGVGVGPGDPELMTLKAARLISNADVIAYPAPESGESFARSIAAAHFTQGVEELPIEVPMLPDRFPHEIYEGAANNISRHLSAGRDVVVLCEGDPFFYGSFMYLYDLLEKEHSCIVVPGVSSLTACAAAAGHPLAGRNSILTVIPGPLEDTEIAIQLRNCEAAAIIKVGRHMGRLSKLIEAEGLTSAATYVERATLEQERVAPLADIPENRAPYFSMILIDKGSRPGQASSS